MRMGVWLVGGFGRSGLKKGVFGTVTPERKSYSDGVAPVLLYNISIILLYFNSPKRFSCLFLSGEMGT